MTTPTQGSIVASYLVGDSNGGVMTKSQIALAFALLRIILISLLDRGICSGENIMLLVLFDFGTRRQKGEQALDFVDRLGLRVVRAMAQREFCRRGKMARTIRLVRFWIDGLCSHDGSQRAFSQHCKNVSSMRSLN